MSKKISELTELAEAPNLADLVMIVDSSASVSKKITVNNFLANTAQLNEDGEINAIVIIRNGTAAEIDLIVLQENEQAWTTDTRELRIGDGVAAGGVSISRSGGFEVVNLAGLSEGGSHVFEPQVDTLYIGAADATYVNIKSPSRAGVRVLIYSYGIEATYAFYESRFPGPGNEYTSNVVLDWDGNPQSSFAPLANVYSIQTYTSVPNHPAFAPTLGTSYCFAWSGGCSNTSGAFASGGV